MPRAGTDRGARAEAHLRWAKRYHDQGNTHKATAHFGRTLEYERAAKFGTGLVGFAEQLTLPTLTVLGSAALAAARSTGPGSLFWPSTAVETTHGHNVDSVSQHGATGCDVCGRKISNGKDAHVFEYNGQKSGAWVVKILNTQKLLKKEVRAYRVLRAISETNAEFQPLQASYTKGQGYILIEKYTDQLIRLMVGRTGQKYVDATLMHEASMTLEHVERLLREFEIMHSAGVSHGDVTFGNIGIITDNDQRRFVIGDPTNLATSPLSPFASSPKPEELLIVETLRAAYKHKLSESIDEDLQSMITTHGLPTESLSTLAKVVENHNAVAGGIKRDRANLCALFGHFLTQADPIRYPEKNECVLK
jgi:tRNA A-37 threonylcarbamoyl transferase component Bud32